VLFIQPFDVFAQVGVLAERFGGFPQYGWSIGIVGHRAFVVFISVDCVLPKVVKLEKGQGNREMIILLKM
jgi:hypothetical protein